ncbi:hypothetical protein F5148DRAFT_1273121 [Russula earlei]|uniref:Uncharacterized protein n=1 Tax=Russula earlei TaxID=71964 RepID=A0ACC0UPC8_9AGAM|nr:hypothetical protein F5148DRAFT_1273121 [Russula earlei]
MSSPQSPSLGIPPALLFPPPKSDPSSLMQRRTAKTILSSAEKQPSRLNQRTLGLPNRIWLILTLFLSILLFTRLIFPWHHSDATDYHRHRTPSYAAALHPINYLNLSDADNEAAQNPFPFCPTFGKGDALAEKYGPLAISKSWLHLGSGARVHQVIHKALLGQPVTISIIGGSISSCHGSGDDPIAQDCYPSIFFDWWNTLFPHPASELTNGAIRKTNSEYFAFCSAHHLPDFTDLVIIELDSDDKPHVLVRSILLRPDSPAIIVLGHFSPQVHEQNGFAGPDHWHSVVSQFYDVPHISSKAALYPSYITSPPSILRYYTDPVLANPAGHGVLADMLIAYIQSQVCVAWNSARGTGASLHSYFTHGAQVGNSPKDATGLFGGRGLAQRMPRHRSSSGHPPSVQVPVARIGSRPSDLTTSDYEEIAPMCVSANDLVNPLPPSLFHGSGWLAHHPPPTGVPVTDSTSHYWYSRLPTSRLRIPLIVGAGDVGIYYVLEPRAVLGSEGSSAIECWVDDNYDGRVIIDNEGDSDSEEAALRMIDRSVAKGSHYIECVLLGAEGVSVPPFKLIGIFAT